MRRPIIALITALVLFVFFVVLCTFVRRPYEKILLTRFGSLVPEDKQVRIMYNWYLKLPTDGIERIDTRLHLNPGTLQEVAINGKDTISVRAFAAWRIVDPVKFYRTINADDAIAKKNMDAKIQGLVHSKLSTHTLDELFNPDETKVRSADIETAVAREATYGSEDGKTVGMREQGIEIVEVGFSRMAFSPNNANAVYTRMVAELSRQAIDFDTRGTAAADKIRAEGNLEAAKRLTTAQAEAAAIRGNADAQALKLIADVQTSAQEREFYQMWKGLEMAKTNFRQNTIFVLPSDSPWISPIMKPPVNGQFVPPSGVAPTTLPATGATGPIHDLPGSPVIGLVPGN